MARPAITTRLIPPEPLADRTAARTRSPIATVISPGMLTTRRSPTRRTIIGTARGTFRAGGRAEATLSPWTGSSVGLVTPSNGTWVLSYSGPRPSSEPVSCGTPNTGWESTAPPVTSWPQKQVRVQRSSSWGWSVMLVPASRQAASIALASWRPTQSASAGPLWAIPAVMSPSSLLP